MHQNPPHHPPHGTAPTEPLPQRAPRTTFFLTVGCLSVIAGLVLGVGGFFGVRALQDPSGTTVTAGGSDGGGDGQGAESTPSTFDEIPVGPDEVVPFGSTFPVHSEVLGGDAEVTATAMDWDATPEILDANSLTLEPEEGNRYVMVTFEGTFHGTSDFAPDSTAWVRAIFIADDGTEYGRAFVPTPQYSELVEQSGVVAGGSFRSELAFELPAEIESGGHLVLLDALQSPEDGVWMATS